jgi:hypothetical protein
MAGCADLKMLQVMEEKESAAKELEQSKLLVADLSVQNEQLRHQIKELQMQTEQRQMDAQVRHEHAMRVAQDDSQSRLAKMHASRQEMQQQLSDAEHENSMLLTRLKAAEEVAESTARDMSHLEASLSSEINNLKVCF